jgi:hypothetical protein
MTRRLISSGSDFEQQMAYSRAVVDGDWIFVAGTTGFDDDAGTIAGDVVAQTEQCFRNIERGLREAHEARGRGHPEATGAADVSARPPATAGPPPAIGPTAGSGSPADHRGSTASPAIPTANTTIASIESGPSRPTQR